MTKIEDQERSFNSYEDRLFYQHQVKATNKYTRSVEGRAAALEAVRACNVLELELPTNGDDKEYSQYMKAIHDRADGFSTTLTEVVTLILMGALSEES